MVSLLAVPWIRACSCHCRGTLAWLCHNYTVGAQAHFPLPAAQILHAVGAENRPMNLTLRAQWRRERIPVVRVLW